MKARILLLGILTALTSLMAFSCERSTEPEQKVSAMIRGKITEPSGSAVSNAAVLLTYNFKTSNTSMVPKFIKGDPPTQYHLYQNSPNPFNPVTDISYDIPAAGQVKLWIMDYSREDTVKILVDEFRETGHYKETWDGKNEQGKGVVNGVYYYHITAGSFSDSKSMILSFPYTDHSSPDTLEHHALTNNDGYFEIRRDFLPFDHESIRCDSAGNEIGIIVITRQVDIWALHNSYLPACVDSVDVHSISGADVTIQFSE